MLKDLQCPNTRRISGATGHFTLARAPESEKKRKDAPAERSLEPFMGRGRPSPATLSLFAAAMAWASDLWGSRRFTSPPGPPLRRRRGGDGSGRRTHWLNDSPIGPICPISPIWCGRQNLFGILPYYFVNTK